MLKCWQENLLGIEVKDINKVVYSFNALLLRRDSDEFPLNIPDFIRMLQNKTLVEIGFSEEEATSQFAYEKIIVGNRLNRKFEQWYEGMKSIYEIEQKAMLEFLLVCRQHREKDDAGDYNNYYRNGRLLVNKNNMIMSNMDFESIIHKRFPRELIKIIKSWRKDIDITPSTITICPVCGKRINFEFGHEGSCSDICNYYISKNKLSFEEIDIKENYQYSDFLEGIYRYILLPGISERIISEKLKQFDGIRVELYPNMDEYDIEITIEDKNVLIDIKDVQVPSELVDILMKNNSVSKLISNNDTIRYLVIPEHRKHIYLDQYGVDYKKELNRILHNEDIRIEVLYEKELYREISILINDEF